MPGAVTKEAVLSTCIGVSVPAMKVCPDLVVTKPLFTKPRVQVCLMKSGTVSGHEHQKQTKISTDMYTSVTSHV